MLINGMTSRTVSVDDRGLRYGDGHFTTMHVKEGRVRLWPAHLARLQRANHRLGLTDPNWFELHKELKGAI
ncbi:MAG: aminodeoxychorismate lyase, partial [Aeromonas sp.]